MANLTKSVSWITDASLNKRLPNHFGRVSEYAYFLYPFGGDLDGPHEPMILFSEHRRTETARRDWRTFRDGWLPLACFFKMVHPQKFVGRVAIPAEFWFVVPPDWQVRVDLYRIVSDLAFDQNHLPKKMLLCGSFSPVMTDVDELEQEIDNFVEALGGPSVVREMEVSALFTYPIEQMWRQYSGNVSLRASAALLKKINLDMSFPSAQRLLNTSSFEGVLYHEFNRGRFIGDTLTKHFVLARGGGLLSSTLKFDGFKTKERMRLSSNHWIELAPWGPVSGPAIETKMPKGVSDPLTFKRYFDLLLKIQPLTTEWANEIMGHIAGLFPQA